MLKPELFHKTVSILVKAYFGGTLLHQDACACAVGNLVSDRLGSLRNGARGFGAWMGQMDGYDSAEGRRQIVATDYAVDEIVRIERAFERGYDTSQDDSSGYLRPYGRRRCVSRDSLR